MTKKTLAQWKAEPPTENLKTRMIYMVSVSGRIPLGGGKLIFSQLSNWKTFRQSGTSNILSHSCHFLAICNIYHQGFAVLPKLCGPVLCVLLPAFHLLSENSCRNRKEQISLKKPLSTLVSPLLSLTGKHICQ